MDIIHLLQILVLAIVQGAAELLPISSSAHVTIAARLMGYDTGRIFEWTFLLVMLHTGTMFSVLIYFWRRWTKLINQIPAMILATVCTAVVGYPLMVLIKHFLNRDQTGTPQEVEHLFQNLPLMAFSLASVGILIIVAGLKDERTAVAGGPLQPVRPKAAPPGAFAAPSVQQEAMSRTVSAVSTFQSIVIGGVQGLALPCRGFSRSGSKISAGILLGVPRMTAEEFSFALAVILTPVVIAREVWMLIKEHAHTAADQATQTIASVSATSAAVAGDIAGSTDLGHLFLPGLLGMVFSFVAGLIALKWLSSWLEQGRWKFFGIYCLAAAAAVLSLHFFQG
jgi:undecaprenyl-diphosphatase